MYEKVRVKKSQIYEENQDTSQKETKTEDTGRVSHLGAAHPLFRVRVKIWFLSILGWVQGLLEAVLHEFSRIYKHIFRVISIYFFIIKN